LFAKLAAGPAGRPAKACLQPSSLQDTLAHQTNTNQTRNEQLPKISFEGSWRMGTSWWKTHRHPPWPARARTEKKTHAWDWGNVGYMPLPREQSPQTPYKRPCDQTTRGPPPLTHTGTTN